MAENPGGKKIFKILKKNLKKKFRLLECGGSTILYYYFHIFSFQFFTCAAVPPGESGLGKSTLINSLFLTDLYSPEYPGPSHRIKKTVQVYLAKT